MEHTTSISSDQETQKINQEVNNLEILSDDEDIFEDDEIDYEPDDEIDFEEDEFKFDNNGKLIHSDIDDEVIEFYEHLNHYEGDVIETDENSSYFGEKIYNYVDDDGILHTNYTDEIIEDDERMQEMESFEDERLRNYYDDYNKKRPFICDFCKTRYPESYKKEHENTKKHYQNKNKIKNKNNLNIIRIN